MSDGERQFGQGILSPTANYRLIVSGHIGPQEMENLISFLRLQKSFLERGETVEPRLNEPARMTAEELNDGLDQLLGTGAAGQD